MVSGMLAYAGLFAWSFLAATVLPLSSEAPLAVLVAREQTLLLPVLVATLGNYLGACTTYWVGGRAARMLDQNRASTPRQQRAEALLRRYGQPVLLLSWVPIIGDALVALAGAMRLPFTSFSAWVMLGKAARYVAVGLAAQALST